MMSIGHKKPCVNIALDYDGTYTQDKELWNAFVKSAKERGHCVYVITLRSGEHLEEVNDDLGELVDGIFGMKDFSRKREVCKNFGLNIDIWIDDNPWLVDSKAPPLEDWVAAGWEP